MKKTIRNNQPGFTLIEVLVVIGIMGILLAIAIPFETSYRKKAEIKRSAKELRSLFWEAQTRALAPRTKDVTAYRIDLVKNAVTGGAVISLQECISTTCSAIAGAQEPKVILGSNIIIENLSLDATAPNAIQTSFSVENNRDSEQISFDSAGSKMTATIGSLIDSSLKYDIVVDGQMNSITYGVK